MCKYHQVFIHIPPESSLLQAKKIPALLVSSHTLDALVSEWPSGPFARLAPVSSYLSLTSSPELGTILQIQWSLPLTTLLFVQHPGHSWHPLPQRHIADSHSIWCSSGTPGPPLQNYFLVSWLAAYTSACSYCFPRYRTLHSFLSNFMRLPCNYFSMAPKTHGVSTITFPTLHHLQIYWACRFVLSSTF